MYQCQCFVVGVEQDVLVVIECLVVDGNGVGLVVEYLVGFEQCGFVVVCCQFDGGGDFCLVVVDDGNFYVKVQVFQVIQSL